MKIQGSAEISKLRSPSWHIFMRLPNSITYKSTHSKITKTWFLSPPQWILAVVHLRSRMIWTPGVAVHLKQEAPRFFWFSLFIVPIRSRATENVSFRRLPGWVSREDWEHSPTHASWRVSVARKVHHGSAGDSGRAVGRTSATRRQVAAVMSLYLPRRICRALKRLFDLLWRVF